MDMMTRNYINLPKYIAYSYNKNFYLKKLNRKSSKSCDF